jgi:hypothetical protein
VRDNEKSRKFYKKILVEAKDFFAKRIANDIDDDNNLDHDKDRLDHGGAAVRGGATEILFIPDRAPGYMGGVQETQGLVLDGGGD